MKALVTLVSALILSASLAVSAQAHPNHHHHNAPTQWVPLEPEVIATFEHEGETYHAINTHLRGWFGLELIEIRTTNGTLKASWWSSNGFCFTTYSYDNAACMSQSSYENIFIGKLKRSPLRNDLGEDSIKDDYEFCNHYSQLEYTLSNDSSGICGYT